MAHYYQTEGRETYCEVCGELTLCDVLAADDRESETGYLDELVLCPECRGNWTCTDESPLQRPHRLRPLG
jgi:hypothetical protein